MDEITMALAIPHENGWRVVLDTWNGVTVSKRSIIAECGLETTARKAAGALNQCAIIFHHPKETS